MGPAALAKAYRFTADPRDGDEAGHSEDRLRMLSEASGMWDCTRCFECVQVCPKGVAPMDRIMALRDQALAAGMDKNYGARHVQAFSDLVEHSGWLDELRIVPMTMGLGNVPALLNVMPEALRALSHGKLPPLVHPELPGAENIRNLFQKVEQGSEEPEGHH